MTGNHILGYAKVYRSLMDKGWYMDSEYVHLWVHLILKANHKGVEILHNGNIVKLNPGQFITGRKKLSAETGIEQSKIERILKLFEKEKQIEQQTNKHNRVISILSWELYQNNEQQMNNERTTSEQQVNTDKNDKNDNNDKKYINGYPQEIEVMQYFKENGYSEEVGKKAFRYYSDAGWKDSKGKKVKNWKQKMQGVWFKDENKAVAEREKYEVAGSRQILLLLPDEYENHPNKQNLYPTR